MTNENHLSPTPFTQRYSEASNNDTWFHELNLKVSSNKRIYTNNHDMVEIDNSLRLSTPPFDGLEDAAAYIGLSNPNSIDYYPSIKIIVRAPVDVIVKNCELSGDKFEIALYAHRLFNVKRANIAIRGVPGKSIDTRLQIKSYIRWEKTENKLLKGHATINVDNCDSILVMLLVGTSVVRRHWFLDREKARNHRLLATQCFDSELKMIRNAVLDQPDSRKFENGIAALLFLLGFSPSVQLETNSPDLIVQTPSGRLILVECTLKISDFSSKIGKIVDRRGALEKTLHKNGHSSSIATLLVCRLPRDQIATKNEEIKSHKIILVTQEDLTTAFDQVRFHSDPDEILKNAEKNIMNESQLSLGL